MKRGPTRTGIYSPPVKTLPYIALVITAEGQQKMKTFPTRKEAVAFTEKFEAPSAAKKKKPSAKKKAPRQKSRTAGSIKAKVNRVR